MHQFAIRLAKPSDVDVITDFNCRLASETEPFELDRETVRAGVARGLAQSREVTYFIAESPSTDPPKPVGQLMLTREWSDWRNGWMMWLQSVYVDANYRQQGVFDQLLEHAINAHANDDDVIGFRLYVERQNERAQTVYLRRQFVDPHYLVLERLK
jgi:ribosomal protein S18 acetylase RimI-like enzyme